MVLVRGNRHNSIAGFTVDASTGRLAPIGHVSTVPGAFALDPAGSSGASDVVGWLNTKMFDATTDAAKSQGWTVFVLDTNGNGKRDDYVEPDQPIDPAKEDKRIVADMYGIAPSQVDGSIWGSVLGYPAPLPASVARRDGVLRSRMARW